MSELLPCPFCGGTDLQVLSDYIACRDCATEGPWDDAVTAGVDWNRRAPQWQPIEAAPRDGAKIDLWFAGNWNERMPGFAWFAAMGFWHNDRTHQSYNDDPNIITHWMPIPEPPQ